MKRIWIAGEASLCNNYVNAMRRNGAYPFVSLSPCPADSFDALLLPGGGDIHPSLFGQKDMGSINIDIRADKAQLLALSLTVTQGKPVLGICKGMQIINIFFGGSIIQDLKTSGLHAYDASDGHDRTHPTLASPSCLSELYGARFTTNSAHHQGIGLPGIGIRVIQRSLDGVPEGILHTSLPVIGVQWHPERMPPEFGDSLFQYFLEKF